MLNKTMADQIAHTLLQFDEIRDDSEIIPNTNDLALEDLIHDNEAVVKEKLVQVLSSKENTFRLAMVILDNPIWLEQLKAELRQAMVVK